MSNGAGPDCCGRAVSQALARASARVVNGVILGSALLFARLMRKVPRRTHRASGRIAAVGTFFNRNWLLAHATPLSRSGVEGLIVVADQPLGPLDNTIDDNTIYACPPQWLSRLLGRALAKLVWLIGVGFRFRPDLYMGYYIVPSGLIALVVGRLFGRPACYQMTGGPREILGGGWATENRLQRTLGAASPFVERLARRVVAEFDLVVVRGPRARSFVSACGPRGRVVIIPGSVDSNRLGSIVPREYDLVYVGRLTEMKRPLQFLDIVAGVRRTIPSVRAIVAGDGPLMGAARSRVRSLDLTDHVELSGQTDEVHRLLRRCRVFVLTSESEGLSIAVAEAMAAGVVPVVSNVGELSELVKDGESGYLLPVGEVSGYVECIVGLLRDTALWSRYSRAAATAAKQSNDVDVVARLWADCLPAVIALGTSKTSNATRGGR